MTRESLFMDGESRTSVMLLGSDGMLGRAFCELLGSLNVDLRTPTLQDCDISDPDSVERAFDPACDVVVNCAAWTDVDGAETHEAEALAVNGGPGLAAMCRSVAESGGVLVHFSTDYVFNGRASSPYPVDHARDPVDAYGRTKASGEAIIEASGCEHLIIRTSWLYGPWGKSFVRTIARLCSEKDELSVVDDQRGRPTSCLHLAGATLALLKGGACGTFHVTDGGECTWFELAREIALYVEKIKGSSCQIKPCSTAEFPRPAARPAYSVLDISGTERMIGQMPHWKSNLQGVLSRLED